MNVTYQVVSSNLTGFVVLINIYSCIQSRITTNYVVIRGYNMFGVLLKIYTVFVDKRQVEFEKII